MLNAVRGISAFACYNPGWLMPCNCAIIRVKFTENYFVNVPGILTAGNGRGITCAEM